MKINYITVGKLIRYYRLKSRITQEELAFRINSTPAYISCLETGKKKPSLDMLTQIADVLGVTVNDFIYDPLQKPTPNSASEELSRILISLLQTNII